MATQSMGIPTAAGLGNALGDYGMGLIAGLSYRLIAGITGSGLIGGAVAAAATGAIVRGPAGKVIAINLGFQTGQQGIGALGLGGVGGGLAGLLGGGQPAAGQNGGLRVI